MWIINLYGSLDNNQIQLVRSTMYQVFDSLVVKYTYTTMLCIVQILWAVYAFNEKLHPLFGSTEFVFERTFYCGLQVPTMFA